MNRSQALLLVLGLLASAAQADIHPNTAPGFQPDQSFHVGDVDNVNLFNGSLTLTLPLGGTYPVNGGFSYGVKLTYNANDWDWIDGEYVDPEDPNHHIKTTAAFPGSCNNAGLGWRISFGRLDPPCQPPNPPFVFYQDENGTNHIFFETLHANDPEDASVSGISRILYTRDGSYLRLIVFNDGTREVESPDGTIRRFNGTGLPEHIRDRFGNKLNFFYGELHPTTHQPVWRLTDSQNRTHYIVFRNDFLSLWGEVVDRVELAAFGGATATYQFSYASADIGLPCPSAGAVGQTGKVFFLTSVALPDGSAWSMPLSDYITAPPPAGASCTDHAGNLIGLTLPTRGRLEWTWQEYKFHQGSSSKPRLQRNSGVAARTMRDIGGAVLGTWTYVSAPAVPLTSNEHTTTVIDPLGHKTVNYFSMAVVPNYTGWSYFDYSLPFTRNQTLNVAAGVDLNLSRQIYNAAGTLLRSEYVLYERDPVQFTSLPPENTNRRMLRSRTLYHDDPAVPYAGIVNSDFDGLGHYRIQQTEGNFSAGSNLRGRYATYNPLRGTYTVNQAANTGSGFSVFPPGSNWVLEAPTLSRDYENGTYSMTEYCYHPGTATVVRERIHRLNSPTPAASQSAQDLMVVHELRDALGVLAQGNVLADKFYGGDAQAGLATGVLDICTMALPPSPEYQINHTYVSGVRATSQYAGTGVVFLNNTVIDANTGLVATSKDLSDVGTGFEYDAMGRLTWVKPDAGHGGWTQYVYTPAAGSSRANVTIRRRDNGSKTAAILNASQIVFDGHGRVFQETRNLPGGTFNKRETVYDAAGNKASVSEWVTGTPTQKTLFSGYDPFGRPSTITPPDGVAHNVTMSYAGVRQVNRTVKIATAAGLNPATTTETYDRHGRLIQVTEPSGTADANVITSYGYDVGNRLISVSMPSQTRTFSYDRAGFLQSETHPELGVSGNGTTFYTRYDSRGHVLRKVDGNNSLTHVYDPAERLFQVKETTGAQRLLKTFSYANANGNYTDPLTGVVCFDYRKNKITQQSRYNYVTVVGSPFTVELREGMTYCGRDGRLSRRSLDNYVNGGATPSESFVLPSVAYDALGNVTTLGYPQCTHAACTAPAPRTVTFSYTEDLLSSVGILGNSGYYASSITYHPNLMVNQVVHNNNPADSTKRLTDTYAIDTNNMMRRPASITVTTPTGVARWSTGTYAYDGAGNISAIGPDTFNYDKVSRLKTANLYLEPTSSVT
ncbi:MAG TPA: RHS repeat domain-containing protein, partial [Thermoanaerobaculia bacterium]|nr:RHS repeat domain-containing protein [Thermoanaerobaculia bacterium]